MSNRRRDHPMVIPKDKIQPKPSKPLSAQRINRNNRSNIEYGENDNSAGGFGIFGSNSSNQKMEKQRKQNDLVSGLEEQIRMKQERIKREKEQEELVYSSNSDHPASSHSRRSQKYLPRQEENNKEDHTRFKRANEDGI